MTLTANLLLSTSVTSIQASLGYIGIAVLAWGTVSALNSVPALLHSAKATEEDKNKNYEEALRFVSLNVLLPKKFVTGFMSMQLNTFYMPLNMKPRVIKQRNP